MTLLQGAGHQLSGSLPQDGFVHSIHDSGSKVNTKYQNNFESQQFKSWFGSSKIVNADGTQVEYYMNIDVKQNDSGYWFYSFAIEKGSRPADVLSVVTDESATTSNKGSKGQLLNMDSSESPQPTPKAIFDGSTTTISIPQNGNRVN
jgi:hypothetical protein